MKKRIIGESLPVDAIVAQNWLDVTDLVEVEITSESVSHPIESALLLDGTGWRAEGSGKQTIRLIFTAPQDIKKVYLNFVETYIQRTQQYVLCWSADRGQSFHEIARQQWNFSSSGATSETEIHHVHLNGVTILKLDITPDISGGAAVASLTQFRIA